MKRHLVILLISVLIIFYISACAPFSHSEPDPMLSQSTITPPLTQVVETPVASHTSLPSIMPTLPLTALEGPLLLIQTGFYEYQYLSPKTQTRIPIELPITDPQFRLSAHLSPSGTQMFFPQDEDTGLIIDIKTNEVINIYNYGGPSFFEPELAAIEARTFVSEGNYSDEYLLELIIQAYQQSKQLLRWYCSDRYHLSVQDADETSTALVLDDHQTGDRLRLDDQPGFVKDFWVGPDSNQILLEKGFIFEPGAWQNIRYYLINVADQTTEPVPLPDGVENPVLSWFSEDAIGVVHQIFMLGGSGFSTINTVTMESKQVIEGDFTQFRRIGDLLFLIRWDNQAGSTTLELLTLDGETVSTQSIDARCNIHTRVSDQIILNCESTSLQVDMDLNSQPFGDPVQIFSPAPDRSVIVLVDRLEHSALLDGTMQFIEILELIDTPLEISWLPDSTGFLYRTRGQLYYYALNSSSSHLLLQSDLFSDYLNINAVWIEFE
jgi:hypothetical protein